MRLESLGEQNAEAREQQWQAPLFALKLGWRWVIRDFKQILCS
jgi:hypothetical protein